MKIRIQHPETGVFISTEIPAEDRINVENLIASAASGKTTYLAFSDVAGNKHFFSEEILKNSIISLLDYENQ